MVASNVGIDSMSIIICHEMVIWSFNKTTSIKINLDDINVLSPCVLSERRLGGRRTQQGFDSVYFGAGMV